MEHEVNYTAACIYQQMEGEVCVWNSKQANGVQLWGMSRRKKKLLSESYVEFTPSNAGNFHLQ
jgi:hypothetical protein